jgi:hypothetical protein
VLELMIGLAVGIWAAIGWGFDPQGALIVGGVFAVLVYAGSCFVWPFRRCGICGGQDKVHDSRGNYRHRWSACWWCRGAKDPRRIGAWLMGRG